MNIGFSFTFYGQSYSGVCISTNGLLAFGSCNTDFANVDLSSAAPGGDARVIAPFWTDLNFNTPGSDAVYYQMLATRRYASSLSSGTQPFRSTAAAV